MSERPTPETDAAWAAESGNGLNEVKEISRRLERERDEAREERDQLKQLLAADSENVDAYLGVCIERDEARKEVEFLKKTPLQQRCQQLERLSDHWCDMHTVAAKERDEAREQLSAAKHFLEKYIAERDEAREAFWEMWQSGDAFLPYIDQETTNRWRKAAGREETK